MMNRCVIIFNKKTLAISILNNCKIFHKKRMILKGISRDEFSFESRKLPSNECFWGLDTIDCASARCCNAQRSENTWMAFFRGCYTLYSTSPCSDTTPRFLSSPFSPSTDCSTQDSSDFRCCSHCARFLGHDVSSRSTSLRRICGTIRASYLFHLFFIIDGS